MYKPINIDNAVKHIKNIVDNIRCSVCDKSSGTRWRYACGHTSCEDCVVLTAGCSECLTPPQCTSEGPLVDTPFTQRVENAVNLLNVFQNEFHVDVYKRQRISEQLKVEKEVFPKCIQAPIKYTNKRKSYSNKSKLDKENRLSQLPGEELSPIKHHKMEKPSENVEMWLNKYVRKPFADLNSNDEILRRDAKAINNKLNALQTENIPLKSSTRKRSHFKTALSGVKNQSLIVDHLKPAEESKSCHKKPKIKDTSQFDTSKYDNGPTSNATNHDESGIGMDEEAVIVIDDSQSIIVDKDKNAWLAVLEAERKKQNTSSVVNTKSIEVTPPKEKADDAKIQLATKVPFYLKSYLSHDTPIQCKDCYESNYVKSQTGMIELNEHPGPSNTESATNVLITVENKTFVTLITIKQVDQTANKVSCMQSVEVQTDTSKIKNIKVNEEKGNVCEAQSQDIFQDEGRLDQPDKETNENSMSNSLNKTQNVIILESESDEDVEASVSFEVTAEIHRSCEEVDYGILTDINDMEEHSARVRRGPRGLTPASTDSSEKENFNPNRIKKPPTTKKKPKK